MDDDGVVVLAAVAGAPNGDVDWPNGLVANGDFDCASSFDVVVDSVVFDVPNGDGLSLDPVPNEKGDFDLVSIPVVDSVDDFSFDGVPNENAGLDVSMDDDVFVVNGDEAPKREVFSLDPSSFCAISFIH